MADSLISILMPVKNAAPWLSACLNSIQQQTETHWELLAVDDHSTDESLKILQDYADQDIRIRVYSNDGEGIISALRLAYAHSTGGFITRMDADDVMTVQKLALLKAQLILKGSHYIATGLVNYFSDQTLGEGYRSYAKWLNQLALNEQHFEDRYKECVIPSPCWMVHRSDLDSAGAFVPDRYPEDYDLCFRFYQTGLKTTTSKETLHLWRDHPNRTSRTSTTYASPSYFELKTHYFLTLDYDTTRPLVLWGAGSKGKRVAQLLQEAAIPFHWVCNTPNKIGKDIYGIRLQAYHTIEQWPNPQLIVVVSAPEAKPSIRSYLSKLKKVKNKDFFTFC